MSLKHQLEYTDRKNTKRAEKSKGEKPAAPSTKKDGRGRPKGSPYADRVPVLVKFERAAVDWLDGEFVRRRLASRLDLIRALVDEARAAK